MAKARIKADQAAGLRRMLGTVGPRVLPIAGGADSHERARIAVGIATAAAGQGQSVVVLDQSRGEVARVTGARPRYELLHLLTGEKLFHEVACECAGGFRLVAAARGIAEIAARPGQSNAMFAAFARIERPASLLILNIEDAATAAKLLPSDGAEVLLVAASSAASMTGAYAHVKQMITSGGIADFRVLLAQSDGASESRHAFERLAATARRFLRARLELGGELPRGGRETPQADAMGRSLRALAAGLHEWNLFEPALAG